MKKFIGYLQMKMKKITTCIVDCGKTAYPIYKWAQTQLKLGFFWWETKCKINIVCQQEDKSEHLIQKGIFGLKRKKNLFLLASLIRKLKQRPYPKTSLYIFWAFHSTAQFALVFLLVLPSIHIQTVGVLRNFICSLRAITFYFFTSIFSH